MSLTDQSLRERLLAATVTGQQVDLSGSEDQKISADLLKSVLLARDVTPGSMLSIRGATIDGELLLSGAQIPGLVFETCSFSALVAFADCTGRMLTFTNCTLASVSCPALALDGSLQLADCVVTGQIDLTGARVGGRLGPRPD
jgi:hypothetical protein